MPFDIVLGMNPLKVLGKNPALFLPSFWLSGGLGLEMHRSSLYLCHQVEFLPVCVSISVFSSYEGISHWIRDYPNLV